MFQVVPSPKALLAPPPRIHHTEPEQCLQVWLSCRCELHPGSLLTGLPRNSALTNTDYTLTFLEIQKYCESSVLDFLREDVQIVTDGKAQDWKLAVSNFNSSRNCSRNCPGIVMIAQNDSRAKRAPSGTRLLTPGPWRVFEISPRILIAMAYK